MLNLNYNINKALGGGGCIGVMKYSYSASFFLGGGGGGGAAGPQTAGGGGGGGGGAQAFSASINIVPNVTYQVNIGAGGARGIASGDNAGGNGQTSSFIYWDDTDINPPVNINCAGGFGAIAGNGGNSANGFIGGIGLGGDAAGGGGAGTFQNGQDAAAPSGLTGGAGGAYGGGGGGGGRNFAGGAGSSYPSIVIPGSGGTEINVADCGGGSGGAGIPDTGNGGGNAVFVGGGGGASDSNTTSFPGGNGGTGVLKIAYVGKPKAIVTNATTTTVNNITTHTFNSGSGTFLYTFPYPYEEPVTPYTVEQCPPTAQPPFVPFPRTDLYSASLVLAIPGAIFTNGYNNVFNQITPYDDIAPYIVSGSILNPNTGKYNPYTNTHSLDFTGSLGFYTASVSVNNFSNVGYETSLLFSGSICLRVSKDIGVGNGVNLSTTKPFVIEGWAAMDVTSSVGGNTGRIFAQKYISGNPLTSSFYSVINYAGVGGPPSYPDVSGSILFAGSSFNNGNPNVETVCGPISSSLSTPRQFRHFAISNTPIAGVQSTIRTYVSGILQGEQTFNYDFDLNPQLFVQLFGDEGEGYLNAASASQVAGGYFQDFRMYNGSNKNYTGSLIPIPQSMIQGLVEPYPIVN
jgi:hypothetical protein